MTKSDIASYLGLSLEAVVRASRRLELQGIVEFVDPITPASSIVGGSRL